MLGRLKAAGLTVEQLKIQLIAGLKTYVQEPRVSVTITEFRSQPVSVFGAVTTPGVHQLQGRKTLVEVLSLAGGLRPDAGQTVIVTRQQEFGRIPARNVREAVSGKYSVAKINLKSVMEATNPEENLLIQPNDVISVPRAQMVYVIGQVKKAGAFVLNERESVSVLQALSMAEGLDRTAAAKSARILRKSTDVAPADVNDTEQVQLDAKKPEQLGQDLQKAQQIPVDLNKILDGTALDVPMRPNDILFVPNSAAKNAGLKAIETAIQLGTGVVIWRR
jgi:polysaccharide export outer membrane protein